jgi:hypothetical protein
MLPVIDQVMLTNLARRFDEATYQAMDHIQLITDLKKNLNAFWLGSSGSTGD